MNIQDAKKVDHHNFLKTTGVKLLKKLYDPNARHLMLVQVDEKKTKKLEQRVHNYLHYKVPNLRLCIIRFDLKRHIPFVYMSASLLRGILYLRISN